MTGFNISVNGLLPLRFFLLLLVCSAVSLLNSIQPVLAQTPPCSATLLMDAQTGEVFEEHNSRKPLPPASMVKLMTAYTVMKQVEAGVVKLDDIVTTSAAASKIGGSQVYLKQGEQFTIDALLDALLIQSGNDVAVALAEHVGGTTGGFVVMMNEEAKRLGMETAMFHFPHGLPPASGQEPDLASAYDFAILSRAILNDFPSLIERTKTYEKPFRDGTFIMRNHNRLLRTFPGADGLKTGYYSKAGFSVVASAERNGIRMLAIVMGCEKRPEREKEAARLLSTGFTKYRMTKLAEKGEPSAVSTNIYRGDPIAVTPVIAEEVRAVVRSTDEAPVEKLAVVCTNLTAPVPAETPCGEIIFKQNGREVARAELIISEAVPEAPLWKRAYQKARRLLSKITG